MGDEWTQGPAGRIVSGSGTGSVRRAVRTCDHRLPVAATGAVLLVVLAALLPLGLAAQDPRQIALMRGRIGVDPEPGSLLAAPARVTVSGLPLGEALSRLAERSRIRIAFSPSLLPADRHVDCECATMSMARALDQLLADTDLGYVELGSQVLLVPRAEVGGHATAALAGVVRDSVNLEPVAFAPVTVTPVGGDPGAVSGVSDRYGAFVLPAVPASVPVRIDVGTVGYAWTRTYDVLPAEPIRALLSPIPISLEGLDVFGSGRAGDPMSLSRDAFVIDTVLLRSLPTIPETDVLRATEVAPSASAASDYTSVPFIRGGTSDGTPTLLDGMRLFNAFHLGGLVSAINADVVKRVTVLPGSGGDGLATGSLSGAFDIATRDGSRDRRRTSGSLGLVSSRFSVEGPVGENVSYLIGGRRTWLDGLTKGLTKIGVMKESFPYSFRDVVAKVATDLGGVRRLSVSAYLNSESMSAYLNSESGIIAESTAIRDSTETALTWGNAGFSVHYRDRFGVQGIVDANLGYSRFRGDVFHRWERPLLEDGPNDTLSGAGSMSETRLGLRVTWHAAGATITTGTQATRFLGRHDYHVAEPLRRAGRGGMLSDFLTPLALRGSQWRLAAYSRVEVPLRRGVSTRGGVRVDRFADLATTLAPFAELAYTGSWWEVRIAGSRSYQALASLRNEEVLLASVLAYDLLVPVREGPIPHNTEFSIGWQGGRRGLRVRVDAYTRHLDHLRLPDLGTQPDTGKVLVDPSLWVLASGAAHGIETSWSWIWDRGMSVLGSYRWAASSRTVGSRTYTPRFHRDHEFELGWSYRHGASSWSARVALRSGQPHTPWLAVVPAPLYRKGHTGVVLVKGEYNSARLPHYARFDVGWRRESRVSWFGGGSVVGYLSVVNVFRRSNVVGPLPRQWEVLRVSPEPTADKVYRQQLPIIPFLGVEFRF